MAEKRTRPMANNQQALRVLRIGILQGGKVIHERLIKPGQSVTIGESEKNTFVFKSQRLPKRHMLFKCKGDQAALCFTDEMSGMIALPGGVVTLKDARANGTAQLRGDTYAIPLSSKSRGKVVIDDITILFQYVAAPPESARLVARQNFRPVLLEEDDPVFLGFLALWGALGAVLIIYALNSEKVDLVEPEDLNEVIAQLADPTVEDEPETESDVEDEEGEGETDEESEEEEVEEADEQETDDPPETDETQTEPRTAEEVVIDEARAAEARQADIQESALFSLAGAEAIGTTNAGDGSGAFVSGQHTAALRDTAGNIDENARGSSSFGESAEVARSDEGVTGSLSDSNTGAQEAAAQQASTGGREVTGIVDDADLGGEELDTSTQGIVKSVIKLRRKQIIDCYNKELGKDPSLNGRVTVTFDIEGGSAVGVGVDGLTSSLQSCIRSRVGAWPFSGVDEAYGIELTYNLQPSG